MFYGCLSGCAKEVEMGELLVESNDISIGYALTTENIGENDIISAIIKNSNCIYEEQIAMKKHMR